MSENKEAIRQMLDCLREGVDCRQVRSMVVLTSGPEGLGMLQAPFNLPQYQVIEQLAEATRYVMAEGLGS